MVHMFFKLEYGLSVLTGEVIPEMKLQKHTRNFSHSLILFLTIYCYKGSFT